MLIDRLRTSAILIAIISVLLLLDVYASPRPGLQGLWLLPLVLFFGLGTAWDIAGLLLMSGRAIDRSMTLAMTGVISCSTAVPMLWPLVGMPYPADCPVGRLGWIAIAGAAGVFLILLREMIRYHKEPNQVIERVLAAVFVSHYVGVPMALLLALRTLGDAGWGLSALLTTIAVTKSADVGAYCVGKLLGRHKLIPWISPGKTWEGLAGGVVAATLVAAACLSWGFPQQPHSIVAPAIAWALVLGPILAFSGLLGDLSESLIKRSVGAKDSGNWLPGLGGVWDVTDSLVAAVMPAFLCFAAAV